MPRQEEADRGTPADLAADLRRSRRTGARSRRSSTGRGRCPGPIGLVVKNGSNARATTSGVMPVPVSVTAMADVLAGRRVAVVAAWRSRRVLLVSIRSLPPSGIASRALMARLRMLFSSWFWSHSVGHRSADQRELELDALAHASGAAGPPWTRSGGLARSGLGSSGCRREKASRRWVSAAARLADVTAPIDDSAGSRSSRPSASRFCARSSDPTMPCSRLLKSWAMPPVSWPTASIFCDWRSASSVRRSVSAASFSSVMSRAVA